MKSFAKCLAALFATVPLAACAPDPAPALASCQEMAREVHPTEPEATLRRQFGVACMVESGFQLRTSKTSAECPAMTPAYASAKCYRQSGWLGDLREFVTESWASWR
jgi:hypothetical protein